MRVLKPRRRGSARRSFLRQVGEKQQRFPDKSTRLSVPWITALVPSGEHGSLGFPVERSQQTFQTCAIPEVNGITGRICTRRLAVSFLIFVAPAGDDEPAAVPRGSTWLFDRTADATILAPEKK